MAEIISGEDKAWEIIAGLSPEEVCGRTGAVFDQESGTYRLQSYGLWFNLDAKKKAITVSAEEGEIFLKRLRYFFVLSFLWYMVKASNAPQFFARCSLPELGRVFHARHATRARVCQIGFWARKMWISSLEPPADSHGAT